MINFFLTSVDDTLEDVSVTETIIIVWCKTINLKTIIFQCSKNYCNPTRVTRLKRLKTWQTQLDFTKRDRSFNCFTTSLFLSNIVKYDAILYLKFVMTSVQSQGHY